MPAHRTIPPIKDAPSKCCPPESLSPDWAPESPGFCVDEACFSPVVVSCEEVEVSKTEQGETWQLSSIAPTS